MALEGRPVKRSILAPVQIQLLQVTTRSSSRHSVSSSDRQKRVTSASALMFDNDTGSVLEASFGACDCLVTSNGNRGNAALKD